MLQRPVEITQYGPITLPCSGALVVSIFSLSLALDSLAQRLVFFLVFGLGLGLPLLVLSFLAHSRSAALLRLFTRHERAVRRFAGAMLIVVGVVDFFDKLPRCRSIWASSPRRLADQARRQHRADKNHRGAALHNRYRMARTGPT